MSALKGFRTFILNGLMLALLIVTAMTGSIDDPEILRWLAIATTVGNVILRFFTDGPAGGDKSTGV